MPTWLKWILGAVAIIFVIGLLTGGDDEPAPKPAKAASADAAAPAKDAAPQQSKPAAPKCAKASSAARRSLEDSLTTSPARLSRAFAAPVGSPPDAPLNGFSAGVSVIAAQLKADGVDGEVLTWVASKEFAETGGGLAFGADSVTREFSDLGTAAASGSPARDYVDQISDLPAYDEAKACAE